MKIIATGEGRNYKTIGKVNYKSIGIINGKKHDKSFWVVSTWTSSLQEEPCNYLFTFKTLKTWEPVYAIFFRLNTKNCKLESIVEMLGSKPTEQEETIKP